MIDRSEEPGRNQLVEVNKQSLLGGSRLLKVIFYADGKSIMFINENADKLKKEDNIPILPTARDICC